MSSRPKTIGSVQAILWLNQNSHGHVWLRTVDGTPRTSPIKIQCGGPKICQQCMYEQLIVDLITENEWLLGLEESCNVKEAKKQDQLKLDNRITTTKGKYK